MIDPIQPQPRQTTVARDYLPGPEFMLMEASFAPLFAGYEEYLEKYSLEKPPEEAQEAIHVGLAASVLWATFQPNDSMIAWSLSLPERQWRFFFGVECGDPARAVARWSAFDEHHGLAQPLFDAQLRRRGSPIQHSTFDPKCRSMREIIDEFFTRSHQNPGRFFMKSGSPFAQMLIALADHDLEWLAGLAGIRCSEALPAERIGTRKPIFEPLRVSYTCGCSPERIRRVVMAAAQGNVPAVFGNEVEAVVECPRCGREVVIRRP